MILSSLISLITGVGIYYVGSNQGALVPWETMFLSLAIALVYVD